MKININHLQYYHQHISKDVLGQIINHWRWKWAGQRRACLWGPKKEIWGKTWSQHTRFKNDLICGFCPLTMPLAAFQLISFDLFSSGQQNCFDLASPCNGFFTLLVSYECIAWPFTLVGGHFQKSSAFLDPCSSSYAYYLFTFFYCVRCNAGYLRWWALVELGWFLSFADFFISIYLPASDGHFTDDTDQHQLKASPQDNFRALRTFWHVQVEQLVVSGCPLDDLSR